MSTTPRSTTRTTDGFHAINNHFYHARYAKPNSYVQCLENIRLAHSVAQDILDSGEWLFPHEEQWLHWVLAMNNKMIFCLDWTHRRPE